MKATNGGSAAAVEALAVVDEGGSASPGLRDELLRLAAAQAALDPDRREQRHHILVSAVVETISLYGPQTVERLHRHISRVWGADTITRAAVEAAVQTASDAGLLSSCVNLLTSTQEWGLSDKTAVEADLDRNWVQKIFETFGEELAQGVNEAVSKPVAPARAAGLAASMFAALAHGANGTLRFAEGAMTADQLRPVSVNVTVAESHLADSVAPAEVADAMQDLLVRVLNPDDPLGNDILRLLIVGNILQGIMAGRDLAAALPADQLRFALDTSTLVHLLGDDTPERALLLDFFERCETLGASIVVTEHVLDEWERLWVAAEGEVRTLDEATVRRLAQGAGLVRSPVVREYVRHLGRDDTGNWTRFCLGRRDPRALLEAGGVVIRSHGNHSDHDRAVVQAVHDRLIEQSDDTSTRGERRPLAAATDAETAGMLARWRARDAHDPPTAWVVAHDRLTDTAFRDVTSSPYPLCLPLSAALLLLSSLGSDDASSVAKLVDTLSSAATRDSFLAVAANYGLDEVVDLSEKMAGDQPLSAEDATIAMQVTLRAMIDDAAIWDSPDERRRLATRAVQQRGVRQLERSSRVYEAATEIERRAADTTDAATRKGRLEGRRERDAEVFEAQQRADDAEKAALLLRRRFAIGGGLLVAGFALAVFALLGALPVTWAAAAGMLLLLPAGHAVKYVRDESVGLVEIVGNMVAAAAAVGLGFLGNLLT